MTFHPHKPNGTDDRDNTSYLLDAIEGLQQVVAELTVQLSNHEQSTKNLNTSAFPFGSTNSGNGPIIGRSNQKLDPRMLRSLIRSRGQRARFFGPDLFADPAWDILLDLAAASAEKKRITISSACLASGVPTTTALRWIAQMVQDGLIERTPDDADRRRVFVSLTSGAIDAMTRFLQACALSD